MTMCTRLTLALAWQSACSAMEMASSSALYLAYISPISRLYLAYLSPISHLYLASISPLSRLYPAYSSPISRLYLAGEQLGRALAQHASIFSWARGDVLLIEDSLKTIATVERLFAFLSLNGVFERIGAVLLGKHELFDDGGTGRRPIDVLREVLGGRSVPIVDGFDSCHTHPMITVPLGLDVEVDFDRGAVTLLEPWLDLP